MSAPGEITGLLIAWQAGDESARDSVMTLVYDELRRIARRHMRGEREGHVLQTTALVNEAYLRLNAARDIDWRTRAHFFALAAEMMRRILVDHARSRDYAKRGGGALHVGLDEAADVADTKNAEVLAIDDALRKLSELDERQARIVEMRYFAGLTIEEIGAALDVSPATVKREWTSAKAWLARELKDRQ